MNFPLVSLIALGVGALIATVGTILLLIAAFRRSIIWGLVVLLLGGLGALIYTCLHWTEARAGFLVSFVGTVICLGGIFTIPEAQERFWQMTNLKVLAATPAPATPAPIDPAVLNAQILDRRQHLTALQVAFAQNGVELTKQYQALDAQRKALKPGNTAAITKFNEAAAVYQARNAERKRMQQEIEAAQKEYDALVQTRSHAGAGAVVAGKAAGS